MAFFKSLFSSKTPVEKFGNAYWISMGTSKNLFGGDEYLKDFQQIPELNAVLNIRARAMSSWRLSIQSKATGIEQTNNETLVRILKNPNWFQSQGEFWRQSSLFRDIYGNEFIYFLTPVGMPNTYKGMFTLDPSRVTIEYKSKDLYFHQPTNEAVRYLYKLDNGTKIELPKENIIHLNDNRVSATDILKGTSKIQSLYAPLQNIKAAYNKRNIALKLPIGIFSNGSSDAIGSAVPMNPKEKDLAQQQLNARDSGEPIFTNLQVKYDAMAVNANTMGLFDEVIEDTGRICDAFGVPYKILSSAKAGTLNTGGGELREAKKQLYEESIIPDAQEKIDALNMRLETANKSWHVVATFNHLPIFSDDIKQRAISLKQVVDALTVALNAGAITIEQYKSELKKFGI